MAPTAFLDRDGTINVPPPEGEYVTRPEALELLPRAGEAVARLNAAGWRVVVVTNQRGVALGRMTLGDVRDVHARLREELAHRGAHLDGIYVCPHAEGACGCRKPAVGLFEQARDGDCGVDLDRAVVIGDSWRDMAAGAALGLPRALIAGPGAAAGSGVPVDCVAGSLWDAVDWALGYDAT